MSRLTEEDGAVVNYPLRLFTERDKRFEGDAGLAKQYADFGVAYRVHATSDGAVGVGGIRREPPPAAEFHAVFYGAAGRRFDAAPTQVLVGCRDWLKQGDGLRDRLVFVGVPEVLQDREGMVWSIVPSFVRLLAPDVSDGVLWNPGEHRLLPGYRLLDEVIGFDRNRELGVFARCPAIDDDELPDKLIEGGPSGMDVVPDDRAQFDWKWLPDPDAEDGPAGLRLLIVDEFIGLVLSPAFDKVFNRVSVSVRSTELRPNTV